VSASKFFLQGGWPMIGVAI